MPWTHGKFYWNELMTRDAERAKRFYGESMGWTFEAMPMPEGGAYWVAKVGEEAAGGVFDMTGHEELENVPEHWMAYIAVDDVDARASMAEKAGGKVAKPAFDIPGVGRIVILKEPGGAAIGWITPAQA